MKLEYRDLYIQCGCLWRKKKLNPQRKSLKGGLKKGMLRSELQLVVRSLQKSMTFSSALMLVGPVRRNIQDDFGKSWWAPKKNVPLHNLLLNLAVVCVLRWDVRSLSVWRSNRQTMATSPSLVARLLWSTIGLLGTRSWGSVRLLGTRSRGAVWLRWSLGLSTALAWEATG